MLLDLVLYIQDVLGYSPLATGVRLMVISGGILVTSTVAGRLTSRMPIWLLIGPGLIIVGIGLLLMRGLNAGSAWTHLIPGMIVGGVGVGLVNPPLASTAVGVVAPQQAGMASGINSTFRQVGTATGSALLGTLFTRAAFTTGLNRILLVAAIIAFVAGVVSLAAIRSRDFVLPGGTRDADGEGSDRAANSDAAQRGRGERQGDDRAGLTAGLDPAAYWGHGPDHRDNPRGDSRHMACRHGCGRDRGYGQDVCHHRADRDGRLRRRVARGQAPWPQLARPAAATRC
jgi:MFS family permease